MSLNPSLQSYFAMPAPVPMTAIFVVALAQRLFFAILCFVLPVRSFDITLIYPGGRRW